MSIDVTEVRVILVGGRGIIVMLKEVSNSQQKYCHLTVPNLIAT